MCFFNFPQTCGLYLLILCYYCNYESNERSGGETSASVSLLRSITMATVEAFETLRHSDQPSKIDNFLFCSEKKRFCFGAVPQSFCFSNVMQNSRIQFITVNINMIGYDLSYGDLSTYSCYYGDIQYQSALEIFFFLKAKDCRILHREYVQD